MTKGEKALKNKLKPLIGKQASRQIAWGSALFIDFYSLPLSFSLSCSPFGQPFFGTCECQWLANGVSWCIINKPEGESNREWSCIGRRTADITVTVITPALPAFDLSCQCWKTTHTHTFIHKNMIVLSLEEEHESLGNSLPFRTWPYCCPRCRRPSQRRTEGRSYWALCHRCPSWLCWFESLAAVLEGDFRLVHYSLGGCVCFGVRVCVWVAGVWVCLGGHTSRVMQISTPNNKNYCVYCTHTCTHRNIHIYTKYSVGFLLCA